MLDIAKEEFQREHGKAGERPRQRILLSKILLVCCLCIIVALSLGYPVFRSTIASYQTDTGNQQRSVTADGIVVLTGDKARIATGLDLLKNNSGKRLLISGVNENTSRKAVFRVGGFSEADLPCCVDIGYSATNTIGNADEAKKWAERHGISSLLVVTSDYHMPRSLLELSHAIPDVKLIPHAAQTDTNDAAKTGLAYPKDTSDFLRHSLREYGKYLVAQGRMMSGADRLPAAFTAKSSH